ncbi:hypothetical protein O181_042289 [Austropuccinia psidii MF-1]|uniref:Uncharacterized protein n=1 Tax=Austropuccinia psidii MF-1 TaxID=1389203 RepID=A0A9Q3DG53_9BASI|nr:hypothetical protein [Austropuccinia psidii MF-1]
MKIVHTRNVSNYSVQPDGCGQGRGKTIFRSVKSSSRKTHMEDARVSLHSPTSVPTNVDVNSESVPTHDNILRAEPPSSGSNRNLTIPLQKLAKSSQRRGVGNMPKPLAEGHELLLTNQELSGQSQKDKELVEEPKSFIHRPEGVGNDSSFGDRRPSGVYQLQKCPKTSPKDLRRRRKVPKTIKVREKANPIGADLTHKGTGSPNWSLQLCTVS